ncbi:hypothetical protein Trydic_g4155 [Trypoxylus dichotomus]
MISRTSGCQFCENIMGPTVACTRKWKSANGIGMCRLRSSRSSSPAKIPDRSPFTLPVGRFICGDESDWAGRHVNRDGGGVDIVEFQRQVSVVIDGGFNENGGDYFAGSFAVGSVHSVVRKRESIAG